VSIAEKLVEFIHAQRLEKILSKEKNEWWVTDIARCPLKRDFEMKYPYIWSLNPRLVMGQLAHIGFQALVGELIGAEVPEPRSVELGSCIVSGQADLATDSEIVELKTGRMHLRNQPSEHHLMQTRLYLWLYGYEQGRIIYITGNRMCEYTVAEPYTDDEVVLEIEGATCPRWSWECGRYCDWTVICEQAAVKLRSGGVEP